MDEKKNRSLAFLEVGIFEIFFVVVVLALLFGILNYFNILPISSLFPDKFGFLPHISTNTHKQSTYLTRADFATPSANFTPAQLKKINGVTNSFITSVILEPYVQQVTLKEHFTQIQGENIRYPIFEGIWQKTAVTGYVIVQIDPLKNELADIDASFQIPKIKSDLTSSSAASVAQLYIKAIPSPAIWNCQAVNNVQECDLQMVNIPDKPHFGISVLLDSLHVCLILPNSTKYSWKTCGTP